MQEHIDDTQRRLSTPDDNGISWQAAPSDWTINRPRRLPSRTGTIRATARVKSQTTSARPNFALVEDSPASSSTPVETRYRREPDAADGALCIAEASANRLTGAAGVLSVGERQSGTRRQQPGLEGWSWKSHGGVQAIRVDSIDPDPVMRYKAAAAD